MDIPVSKRQRTLSKLDRILDGVQSLTKRGDIVDKIISVYECVICKDVMQKAWYAPCCKRVIGCSQCVQRWFDDHDTCPHCSVRGSTAAYTDVRGMDDMLTMLRSCAKTSPQSPNVTDSDSDFELPNVNFRCSMN